MMLDNSDVSVPGIHCLTHIIMVRRITLHLNLSSLAVFHRVLSQPVLTERHVTPFPIGLATAGIVNGNAEIDVFKKGIVTLMCA